MDCGVRSKVYVEVACGSSSIYTIYSVVFIILLNN
jgi:hypothetical protein